MERKTDAYERPEVVDYGTLVELTAALSGGFHEDGLHKGPDHSKPHRR
jgi:hypothetical protein